MDTMNEYEHHDGDDAPVDDGAQQGDPLDDHFGPHENTTPLPDDPALQHTDAPELHFPGDEPIAEDEWSDDADFTAWLGAEAAPEAPEDPATDSELRSELEAPDEAEGLTGADQLIDWTLRQR